MRSPQKKDSYIPALGFHFLTPFYDTIVRATVPERAFKQALIKQAAVAAGDQVLDLGTGTGTLAIWLKQMQPQAAVSGIDIDPTILAKSRKKAEASAVSIHFQQASALQLPFPDAFFDRVASSMFFHHLTGNHKARAFEELFRVMKPGGELHIADWGRPANIVMRVLFLSVQLVDGFAATRDNVMGRLPTLIEQAGFGEVEERRTFCTLFGSLSLYSAKKPE